MRFPHERRRRVSGAVLALVLALSSGAALAQPAAGGAPAAPSPEQTAPLAPASLLPAGGYGQLPAVTSVTLSSDGAYVAMVSVVGGQQTVLVRSVARPDDVAQVGVAPARLIGLQWAGPTKLIMTLEVTGELQGVEGGGDKHLLPAVYDVATRRQTPLLQTGLTLNTIYALPQVRFIQGNPEIFVEGQYFRSSIGVNVGVLGILRVRPTLQDPDILYDVPPDTNSWLVDDAGAVVAVTTYDRKSSHWSLRVRARTGWRELDSRTVAADPPRLAGLGRDGRGVVLSDQIDGQPALREIPLDADKLPDPFVSGPATPLFDRATDQLVGVSRPQGSATPFELFDVRDQALQQATLATFPTGANLRLIEASFDHQTLLMVVRLPDEPPAVAVYDVGTRQLTWVAALARAS